MGSTKKAVNSSLLTCVAVVFFALAMFVVVQPAHAYDTSGKCGDNITWTWDAASGTLTLAGSGATYSTYYTADYPTYNEERTPWVANDWAKDIKTINIGEGITGLGQYLFYNCTTTTAINFPTTLASIGRSTFYDCYLVETLDFSNTKLTSTGSYPFDTCNALKTVKLPEGITSLAYGFYNDTPSLENINWPSTLTTLSGATFWNSGITSVTLPETITKIDRYTFEQCANLTTVVINSPVKIMGQTDSSGNITYDYTFYQCPKLTSVTLPDTLTAIGPYGFCGCTALKSLTLPGSLTSIGVHAFDGCTALQSITYDNACTSIGMAAFRNCTSLTTIVLPNSITSIDMMAYQNCTSLKAVLVPEAVTSLGAHAFGKMAPGSFLYVIGDDLYKTIEEYPDYYVTTSRTTIIHGKGTFTPTVSIGSWYEGDTSATPSVSGNVGKGAVIYTYYSDEAMTQEVADISKATAGIYYLKATIAESDFYQAASATTSFKIGTVAEKKAALAKGKAYTIGGLKYTITKGSITGTGTVALRGVKSKTAKTYTIPTKVSILGVSFKVTSMGAKAFSGCSKATKVTISSTVIKIGKTAFKGCSKLKTLTVKSTKITKASIKNSLKGSKVTTVKVSKSKVKAYKKIFTEKNCGKKVTIKS